jgi:hypothetical protein
MAVTLAAARGRRFSISDRVWSPVSPRTTTSPPSPAPPGADRRRGHPDQLGEATAEAAQRGTADREAGLGDAAVATAQQRHRALDASGHQVAVRRLVVGQAELAAEARPSQSRSRSSWLLLPAPRRPGRRRRRPAQAWPQLLGHDLHGRSGRCRPQRSTLAAGAGPPPRPGCPAHDESRIVRMA